MKYWQYGKIVEYDRQGRQTYMEDEAGIKVFIKYTWTGINVYSEDQYGRWCKRKFNQFGMTKYVDHRGLRKRIKYNRFGKITKEETIHAR